MTLLRTAFSNEIRPRLRMPTTWYAGFGAASLAVIVVATLYGLPAIAAATLAIAVLPPIIVVTIAVAFIPVRGATQRTVLGRLGSWGLGLVWTGLTFALGAYVATLVALDLEHVGSAVTANDYFYSFLGIVLSCVALVAVTGVLVASAWTFFSSDTATRSRATLRALTTRSTRDSMSLRTRMWLDGGDDEAMPTLASRPRTDHAVRALASETGSSAVIGMTLIFVAVTLMLFPAVIGLYT